MLFKIFPLEYSKYDGTKRTQGEFYKHSSPACSQPNHTPLVLPSFSVTFLPAFFVIFPIILNQHNYPVNISFFIQGDFPATR